MIYKIQVYHARYTGSWSDYYLVEAETENEAKEQVLRLDDVASDNTISKHDLRCTRLDLSSPEFLWSTD